MKKKDNINSFKSKLNNSKKMLLPIERLDVNDLLFMVYDAAAVTVAYFFALWFRFDCNFSEIPEHYLNAWLNFTPIYVVISIVVFWVFHLYQSIWKYVSLAEIKRIIRSSCVLAVLHTVLITVLFCRMPISYYIIGVVIQFILIILARFGYRFISKKAKVLNILWLQGLC